MAARSGSGSGSAGRTAVKPGSRSASAKGRSAATQVRGGRAAGGTQPVTRKTVPGRRQEIIALILFGIAVFLIFVLVAGDVGGFVGRGMAGVLAFLLGHVAFLAPFTLLVAAVTTVLEVKLRRTSWFAGTLVFFFGLIVLMGSAFEPIGTHGEETFVRSAYEARAGIVGEGIYALFHRLIGTAGVVIIGWTALFAGFSLATGLTIRRMGSGTKRAAMAVKASAGRSTLVKRARMERLDEEPTLNATASTLVGRSAPEGFDDLTMGTRGPGGQAGPWFGPQDLVGAAEATGEESTVIGAAAPAPAAAQVSGPFVGEFDEWGDGSEQARSPVAGDGTRTYILAQKGLLDGEQAFADLYVPASGCGTAAAAGATATGPADASETTEAPEAAEPATPKATMTNTAQEKEQLEHDPEQETLPGLARKPRQIELAVDEPAYLLPESDLLRKSTPSAVGQGSEHDTAGVLLHALAQFGVEARVIGMVVGPRVTRYELQLAPGTKVSKVTNLKDDLAYALASTEIRILAPIPGKSAVGVEVPNQRPDFVTLGDIYREFPKSAGPLNVWLGKDISGKAVYTDLARLPHLLIAGTTGSGKSGCVNCIVSSILLRSTPEQVRLIMIDPKKVELSHYDRIPHLLVPVVTNMKDAAGVLYNVAKEMEGRYELMELEHSRNLSEMNKARVKRGERQLPYIVVVIDELADLMMVSPQEVEEYVIRLAQKSRAVGIHLVVATQRPSADVITGMIKANIPSRIAFAVSSQTDSRVILDVNGAETLLGMGDMLFKPLGSSNLQRVQGAYITEEEIAVLVNHWRHQAEPEFREELLRRPPEPGKKGGTTAEDEFDPDSDDFLVDAARLVVETGSASVSMLQRRLRVGYTRAGRLIDMLERRGIVGPWEGSKPRQILVDADEFEQVLAAMRADGLPEDETGGD